MVQMLADFFTKPLQGALYRKFRDVILGYARVDSLAIAPLPELEERVGSVRANDSGSYSPVAEGTVDENAIQPAKEISWADVVKSTIGQQKSKCSENVFERSLSRNNPVSEMSLINCVFYYQ